MGDANDPFMRNQNSAVQARTKAQNRANVLQLKLIGQSHPTGLTNSLLKLFEPRPPLEFKPPPEKRKCPPYTGMAQYVSKFAEPGDAEYSPPVPEVETPVQRRARIHQLRLEKGAEKAAEELQKYDPNSDPNISGDPYKTLFVARLNYETTESRIKREFESYGSIKRVRLIADKESNKPRGYAFIEFVHTRDMKSAYKQADGRKIDGKRVLVDVERGRTVPNWRPRRLGGGLGTSRIGGEEVNQRNLGRDQPQSGVAARSEEPRIRDDQEREKSRERGRERDRGDREKSRERSHDRPRDRDHREKDRDHREKDRDHKDKEKDRERGRDRDRDRDRGSDRTRDRDRGRDRGHDRDRGRDRDRDRTRDRERDIQVEETDRGRSRDRESQHDVVDRHVEKDYDRAEPEDDHGYYEQKDYDYDHRSDHHRSREAHVDDDRYADKGHNREDLMEDNDYNYDRSTKDQDREYRRSERSLSRD